MSCTMAPVGVLSKKSIGRFNILLNMWAQILTSTRVVTEEHQIAPEVTKGRLEPEQHQERDADHRKGIDAAVIRPRSTMIRQKATGVMARMPRRMAQITRSRVTRRSRNN